MTAPDQSDANPMPDEVERIAAGLTKAQRQMVISARETIFGSAFVMSLRNRWATKIILNLRGKSISTPSTASADRLTQLGLAVRAHLLERQTQHD